MNTIPEYWTTKSNLKLHNVCAYIRDVQVVVVDGSEPHHPGPGDNDSSWQVFKGKKQQKMDKPSTNSNAKKTQSLDPITRNEVLAAMHSEMSTVNKRSTAVVVSGLPSRTDIQDIDQFNNLCIQHLQVSSSVKSMTRIGTKKDGKMQPLLVHLSSPNDVITLLSVAKNLRTAKNDYVKTCVYINRHLTKAEATAAWESRVNRRKKQSNPGKQDQASAPDASAGNSILSPISTDASTRLLINPSAPAAFKPAVDNINGKNGKNCDSTVVPSTSDGSSSSKH